MERDLLSRFTGNGGRQRLQVLDPRPPPSPTLGLRVGGSEEERQSRVDATVHGHGHAPRQAQTAANMVSSRQPSSRVPVASGRLASVVVTGHPAPRRRPNLPAGASAQPGQTTCAQPSCSSAGPVPQRPPTSPVPTLQLASPATATGQEHCDACSLCGELLRGLAGDLDRARAQVALLTCENESLRYQLKHAAAATAAEAPAASSAHLNLRCRACLVRPATVVLVPRDHLCLCGHCSDASHDDAAIACPVCPTAVRTEAAPLLRPSTSSWPSIFVKRG